MSYARFMLAAIAITVHAILCATLIAIEASNQWWLVPQVGGAVLAIIAILYAHGLLWNNDTA